MLWIDNAGFDSGDGTHRLCSFYSRINETSINVFGGVHFKYQPTPVQDISTSVDQALTWIKTVTLSGPGTGMEADLKFIQKAVGHNEPHRFALASGVSEENVRSYKPYIGNFLVASSICKPNSDEFDEDKLSRLCNLIHKE